MRSRVAAATAWLAPLVLLGPSSSSAEILFDRPAFEGVWPIPADSDEDYISAIAVGDDGSVWVAADNDKVLRLHDGAIVDSWPLPEQMGIERIYPIDGDRLCLIDHDHDTLWVFGTDGTVLDSWWLGPWNDAGVDRSGQVAIIFGSDVTIRDISGNPIRSWQLPTHGSPWPYGWTIAVSPEGRIYIAEGPSGYDSPRVTVWSLAGELLGIWPDLPINGQLCVGASGTVYLGAGPAGSDYYQVDAFSPDGVHLARWVCGDDIGGDWPDSYGAPACLADDAEGHLLAGRNRYGYAIEAPPRIEIYAPLGPGVIFQPDKDDVSYTVDGSAFTGRQRFLWPSPSSHVVSAPLSTLIAPGTRRDFVSWSDGGAAAHEVVVSSAGSGERLRLQTFHFVTTSVDSGGQVTPSAWFAEGATATLSATPAPGYRFVKWQPPDGTGWGYSVLNAQWEFPVISPVSWKAHFIREGLALTISASETDPWINRAEPVGGPRRLYLWAAYLDRGISALEADVTGSLAPMVFTPADGVFNLGAGANLLCAIAGCPIGADAPRLLGYWTVMDDGGDLCLAPSAANDLLVLVQCPNEIVEAFDDFRVVGFSSIGAPCDLKRDAYSRVLANRDHELAPESASQSVGTPELRLASPGVSRGTADLAFDLPARGLARVRLVDIRGRLVRSLVDGELPGGAQRVSWDARDSAGRIVPAGVYFVRLEWQGRVRTEKLVYLGR